MGRKYWQLAVSDPTPWQSRLRNGAKATITCKSSDNRVAPEQNRRSDYSSNRR